MYSRSVTLYCFTPFVTLLTFLFEAVFAAYTIIRYRMRPIGRLVAVILICLGLFQLAEYLICMRGGATLWTIIGWVSITILPALGVHLVSMVIGRKNAWLPLGYWVAAAFIVTIVAVPDLVTPSACPGEFVVFDAPPLFSRLYGAYYLGFIGVAVVQLASALRAHEGPRSLVRWGLIGYGSFLIPTAVIYVFSEVSHVAVPSIMCGFALLLSVILVARVLPLAAKQ